MTRSLSVLFFLVGSWIHLSAQNYCHCIYADQMFLVIANESEVVARLPDGHIVVRNATTQIPFVHVYRNPLFNQEAGKWTPISPPLPYKQEDYPEPIANCIKILLK